MTERELHDAAGRLSPRQRECLRLVFRRRTSKQIAVDLGLSPGTVDTYISEAVTTLGATSRREASEMLALVENRGSEAPGSFEFEKSGVPSVDVGPPPSGHGSSSADWRRWLPIRPQGATQNDLHVVLRLAWIPAIAVALAIGFGMLVVALELITDLFRGGR